MLPATAAFMVVAPILLITGITILSMGILYRIREQIISSLGLILLGLGFVFAVLALNSIDESLMIKFGWKYEYVKLLEAGILNPFKGGSTPSFIQIGAWAPSMLFIVLASLLIILGITLLSYVGSVMLGLEGVKSVIIPVIILLLGLAGTYYLYSSSKMLLTSYDIPTALAERDTSAILRTASLLIGFIVLAIGAVIMYAETRGKEYLVYASAYVLSGLGWSIIATSFFTDFERRSVLEFIETGTIKTPVGLFILASILIVAGSVGLLLASTIEVIGSALGAAEEELEEFEEELGVEEEAVEEEVEAVEAEEAAEEEFEEEEEEGEEREEQ